jgi:CRISPR-associated protein Csc1
VQYVIYRCDLTLHDFLFFASVEKGKVAETSPFVHNYALTYALGWAPVVWYNGQQKARYFDNLSPIHDCYITPARLIQGASMIMQYNTLSEQLKPSKERSIGYPDWGFIKCFRPGTRFRAYVLSNKQEVLPRYIRLGKFMSKTQIGTVAATSVEEQQGACKVAHLLNWSDLRTKPVICNVLASSLPTRLISQALFEEISFLHAAFPDGDELNLPLDMGYLMGV